MSAPRTKRQFAGAAADPSQRQITSFFAAQSPSDISIATTDLPCQPSLPASVQANLLSVGMRIRKSVPEGYKTTTPSVFKLWSDNAPIVTSIPATQRSMAISRELLPFCGINKVGGLDTQPEFHLDEDGDDVPGLDAVPGLTLSQESVESNISTESSRKRIFDEDDASEPMQRWAQSKAWEEEVSPRSLAPVGWGNARVMAIPRSRMKKPATFKGIDQENMALDTDFDDAEFLVYSEGSDLDMPTA